MFEVDNTTQHVSPLSPVSLRLNRLHESSSKAADDPTSQLSAFAATPGTSNSSEGQRRQRPRDVLYEEDAGAYASQRDSEESGPIRMPPAYNPAWDSNRNSGPDEVRREESSPEPTK